MYYVLLKGAVIVCVKVAILYQWLIIAHFWGKNLYHQNNCNCLFYDTLQNIRFSSNGFFIQYLRKSWGHCTQQSDNTWIWTLASFSAPKKDVSILRQIKTCTDITQNVRLHHTKSDFQAWPGMKLYLVAEKNWSVYTSNLNSNERNPLSNCNSTP